ncbi:FAD-binding oxidoreductase [Actinomadura bangladeshensis]|jgi:benzoate/toluate 1,2-dioxygenase reductase subunit|uniref:2Fe-2S iron-sulfur cluster binding domain-containing protein n=1 Tax=Actinomadura bangladeshensis TaxID=453573 RepID=A0A6L9QTA7_9ACTN|nr:FAD-binding oxidoreductase [Actinomadura bangladeshensis]NEA28740.1 2Fe-2S iron-sulfur cluster binding domain-containing protein [Actinomadura bangladeshensis]
MTAHVATIRFEDGEDVAFPVPAGGSVLDAADGAGYFLASQCRAGSCGTCAATLTEGRTCDVPGRAQSLLPSERSAGTRLLCSTLLDGDATFEVPYPIGLVVDRPAKGRARVTSAERLSGTVTELALELVDPPETGFLAGQYARLKVPGTDEWRSYSMATCSAQLPEMRFCVKLIPGGAMTGYLEERCAPGDEIEMEYPLGAFTLRESAEPHIFVAGGTGLAPVLAMLDELRTRRGPKPPVTLCFACQSENDLFYLDEIEMRGFWMPSLEARVAVTEGAPDSPGVGTGTPVSLLGSEPLAPESRAYVCGPPGMITAAVARLGELGVPPDRIHTEKFVATDV